MSLCTCEHHALLLAVHAYHAAGLDPVVHSGCACILRSWTLFLSFTAYTTLHVAHGERHCWWCRKWRQAALVLWPQCHTDQLLCDSGQGPAVKMLNGAVQDGLESRRRLSKAAAQLVASHAGAFCIHAAQAACVHIAIRHEKYSQTQMPRWLFCNKQVKIICLFCTGLDCSHMVFSVLI